MVQWTELLLSRGRNVQIPRDYFSAVNLAIFDSEASDEELECLRRLRKLLQEHRKAADYRSKMSKPPKEGLGPTESTASTPSKGGFGLADLPRDERLTINYCR